MQQGWHGAGANEAGVGGERGRRVRCTEQFVIPIESLQTILRLPALGEDVERDVERRLMYWNLHERAKPRHQIVEARHVEPLEAIRVAALHARQLFLEGEHVERLDFAA